MFDTCFHASFIFIHMTNVLLVERGSSVVECRTRNTIERARVRTPFATVSKFGHFRSLHAASVDSAVPEYLAIDSGGHVSE